MSRDPSQCSELMLSLQALLEPAEEIEIVMDRRRASMSRERRSERPVVTAVDRRRSPGVELEIRTKGFALVAAPIASGSPAEDDADARPRFANIVSFRAASNRR